MAIQTNEPRALSAALAAPAFTTRGAGVAMHVADRHIERWAPERTANQQGSLRSLGFVDRLVSPWLETAQRSASMRLLGGYTSAGFAERAAPSAASWVFPRPWYQDELDWMAAARQVEQTQVEPSLFTTRGTFVAPSSATVSGQQQVRTALPAALYEYIAPSLSIASAAPQPVAAPSEGPATFARAYSPLVPLAAVQAAEVMSRAVAPMLTGAAPAQRTVASTPALRDVLSAMLARASAPAEVVPTRASMFAPELATPPAPRPEQDAEPQATQTTQATRATELAERYAEQRARLVEVQRVASTIAARSSLESAARAEVETRAIEQRTQQELARRIAETRTAEPTSTPTPAPAATTVDTPSAPTAPAATTAPADAAAAERARIEERVAQRLAERVAQRLHDQARTEAAQHARVAPVEMPRPIAAPAIEQRVPPPEVLAAIAALPPELSAAIGRASGGDRRPERLLQTIDAIQDSFRAIELIARSASAPQAGHGPMHGPTHGPRLMMPAGMGGLVAAVDRAQVIADRPAALTGQHTLARPMLAPTVPSAAAAVAPRFAPRAIAPTVPVWVESSRPAPSLAAPSLAPTSALGAAIANEPTAALGHVAWADRWIARFAGASPAALAAMGVALPASPFAASRPAFEALAGAAPQPIFVSPVFDTDRFALPRTEADAPRDFAAPQAPQARLVGPSLERAALRVDDSAPTPDDVFVAIASATARARTAAAAPPVVAPPPVEVHRDRESAADVIARSAPVAPGAGLAPQLASSPFAPALRHMLPLPSAPAFDVRALFGDRLSATYLAGLLAPESHEVTTAQPWVPELLRGLAPEAVIADSPDSPDLAVGRAVPSFEPSYVETEQPRVEDIEGVAAAAPSVAAMTALPPSAAPQEAAQLTAAITTLRSALLSWDVVIPEAPIAMPGAAASSAEPAMFAPAAFAPAIARTLAGSPEAGNLGSGDTARQMLEAMSLPMLGDLSPVGDQSSVWTAPGMVANRAHSWSVAQERSTTDLSLDFVTPELVLAARVYGLGPAEAAQAARLAIAGPGQLSAMASTVDRTFVQAMAIEAERRERAAAQDLGGGSLPVSPMSPTSPMSPVPGASPTAAEQPASAPRLATAYPTAAFDDGSRGVSATIAPPAPSAFGVERRAPRGAFLWPSATVAALRLDAPSPDGEQSMSVAALELLAAQAVAEIGTFAAFGGDARATASDEASGDSSAPATVGEASTVSSTVSPTASPTAAAIAAHAPELRGVADAGETEVLAAATAMVPSARRARFEALYVALGQSAASRSWSPAARAARALALASRTTSDEAPLSARERAMSAWDVLPIVYASPEDSEAAASTGAADAGSPAFVRASRGGPRTFAGAPAGAPASSDLDFAMPTLAIDTRPGLSTLSARAGEAIGSYVIPPAPSAPSAAPSTDSSTRTSYEREHVDVPRGPTAAQELVRTGRPAGRHGGGETEIPAWFEAAARKMLEERSSVAGDISMAELTFVAAAPPTQIAASSRSPSAPAPSPSYPSSGSDSAGQAGKGDEDDEKLVNDLYRSIMAMMDAARARNGEPYL